MFPNQFNFHVDMLSAREALESGIPTVLIPTEYCKGSPWQLNHSQLKDVLRGSPPTIKLIDQYYDIDIMGTEDDSDESKFIGVPIFDFITHLAFNYPELFDGARSVEPYIEMDHEGTEIIRFHEGGDGSISMFRNDSGAEDKAQLKSLDAFHHNIRTTFNCSKGVAVIG
jgi:inosine-uridine nucleoside N-ribohydrolase